MAEIRFTDRLKSWASYLKISGQKTFPPNILDHGVQAVVMINHEPGPVPVTIDQDQLTVTATIETGQVQEEVENANAFPLDCPILFGRKSQNAGLTDSILTQFLLSPADEDSPVLSIENQIAPAYDWEKIDVKVDGWDAILTMIGDLSAFDGERMFLDIEIFPEGDESTNAILVYHDEGMVCDGSHTFTWNMTGHTTEADSLHMAPSTWNGFIPKGWQAKIFMGFTNQEVTFPASTTTFKVSAYGRAQINNGNNGTKRVPRPLGLS